jgi:hypothetical protein
MKVKRDVMAAVKRNRDREKSSDIYASAIIARLDFYMAADCLT